MLNNKFSNHFNGKIMLMIRCIMCGEGLLFNCHEEEVGIGFYSSQPTLAESAVSGMNESSIVQNACGTDRTTKDRTSP